MKDLQTYLRKRGNKRIGAQCDEARNQGDALLRNEMLREVMRAVPFFVWRAAVDDYVFELSASTDVSTDDLRELGHRISRRADELERE